MQLSTLAFVLALSAVPQWAPNVEYRLEGELVAVRPKSADELKRFQISLFTDNLAGDASQTMYWTLTENGRGQAPWLERFGAWQWKPQGVAEGGPALFYQRDDGLSIVPLPPAAISTERTLQMGAKWTVGKRDFEVVGTKLVDQQPCWQIRSQDLVGRRLDMTVEKSTRIVVKLKQNLFLGRGERFELSWRIAPVASSKPQHVAAAIDVARQMIEQRNQLGRKGAEESRTLNESQRAAFAKSFAVLNGKAKGSPIESVLNAASRDVMTQGRRADSVASLRQRALGRSVAKAKLTSLQGGETAVSQGKITVLHFWEYREKPLKEPYGQTAYVDFLYRNRKPDQVDVFGVNVDTRLGIKATQAAAVRSAKRFRTFMNLSYPLLMDDGTLLGQIGDPRPTGAKLPLYVVLDEKGRVIEYKSGLYEVDRRDGLKELSDTVSKALSSSE